MDGKKIFTATADQQLAVVKVEHETTLFTQQPFDGLFDLTMAKDSIVGAAKDLPSSVFRQAHLGVQTPYCPDRPYGSRQNGSTVILIRHRPWEAVPC